MFGRRMPHLEVACRCGGVRFEVGEVEEAPVRRCHCKDCRRFACAAFASTVAVAAASVPWDALASFAHRCEADGDVVRFFCGACRSKVATRVGDFALLAAGSIERMPPRLATRLRMVKDDGEGAPWWRGREGTYDRTGRGSCACGRCSFEAVGLLPGELQHCYCSICRHMSGTAFQTWMPCRRVEWLSRDDLELVRTTGHGMRHQCRSCGGVMTIVYDAQPDTVWPAAGAIDDGAMPSRGDRRALYREIHICCATVPEWYGIPSDGLPRLRYAS